MVVVSIITAIEERIGAEFPKKALDGVVFDTVGSLLETFDRISVS